MPTEVRRLFASIDSFVLVGRKHEHIPPNRYWERAWLARTRSESATGKQPKVCLRNLASG